MKTKLVALLTIGLLISTVSRVANVANSSSAQPNSPSTQIRNNISAMLQRKAPIKVLPDIPGGASTATNQDAAYYAWQEFVAKSTIDFRYVAYTCDHEQVALVITQV